MNGSSSHSIELEVYRTTFETWRFEVDSYWQRNSYFAAFETAAITGCWYLLEKDKDSDCAVVRGLRLSLDVDMVLEQCRSPQLH